MSTRRSLATFVVSAALTLGATAPAAAILVPEPGPRSSEPAASPRATETPRAPAAAVEADDVMAHLKEFQAIAEAHDGNRAAGTAGHEASAQYVEEQLAAAGYDTWRQSFPFIYEETRSSSLMYTVGQTATAAAHLPMAQSPGTADGGVTGRLVTPSGAATGCAADDWSGVDVTGGIALLARGGCTFAEKAHLAADAGAAALVVHNTTAGLLNGTLGGHPEEHIPSIGVTEDVGQDLQKLPAGATLSISLDKIIEERQTFSVLAQTQTGRQDRVVMLGGHLDSGGKGPGINDNGTGSAVLLETAVQLAGTGEPVNAVRFAWWGASDLGNLGSRDYVSDLAADDPEGLREISVYVDVDTVASPNHIIGVQDADEAGSALTDYLDSIGQAWVETAPTPDSDAQPFIDQGVHSTGLFTGAGGRKTVRESELFGGRAGLPYDPNHDTVADDLDNVDLGVLQTTTATVAHAVETFASRR